MYPTKDSRQGKGLWRGMQAEIAALHQEPEKPLKPLSHLADEATAVIGRGRGGLEQHVGALDVTVQHAQRVQVVHAARNVHQAQVDRRLPHQGT